MWATELQHRSVQRVQIAIFRAPRPRRSASSSLKNTKRLHAKAIKRILDQETRELVGWLYEWNNGDIVPRWKAKAQTDVIYEEG